jgi:hypothetical protein
MSDSAFEKFNSKFSLPSKPADVIPEIPSYLDDLNDSELMKLYGEFMAWLSYAKAELVKAEIDEERTANNCKVTEAQILIGQWGNAKGDTVTLAKARRDTDPDVLKAQDLHSISRAYRKLVESVYDRCERGTQLLSRELSRRISSSPQERRQARYNP